MKSLHRILSALATAVVLSAAAPASHATPIREGAVEVELVADADAVVPGRPLVVACRVRHDPEWHSYWLAAGTGYPTTINWDLPAGFTAGPIQWPVPHVIKDAAGKIVGNGYAGEIYLLTEITPPVNLVPGQTVKIGAGVEWLMCRDVCVPGSARLSLTLPVVNAAGNSANAAAAAVGIARQQLPTIDPNWKVVAAKTGAVVTLKVSPAPGMNHQPSGLHFFSADGLTDYAQATASRQEGRDWVLEMPVDPAAQPNPARLTGVLVSASGWRPGSGYAGIQVDAPLESSSALSLPADVPAGVRGLIPTLALAFLGGLVLNLMPCVFPVLGIKILGFVNQAGNDRRKISLHGLVFAAGVLLSFWTLAGVLLVLRTGGAQLGWGFQLQSPAFVFGLAAFMLVFALNMSGLFEVGLAATGVGGSLQMKSGYGGSFFTGALATVVATPCSAPFLAPALGAALSLPALQALLIFTLIALGLALPYLLLSLFPQAIRWLPRPGAWMETFKQFMAFPLYATAGWLVWVLAGQTHEDDNALLLVVMGLVLVAMAAWAYGRFGQAHGSAARRSAGQWCAALLLVAGLYTGWPRLQPATVDGTYAVNWQPWSPESVSAARAAGKFVYVDFTARWCATCQTNKATVFHSPDVLAEFGRRGVVLLRGDWTNRDPRITAELGRWKRSAVPFNLIYTPGRLDPVVLPELLTAARVLDALGPAAPIAAK